MYHGQVHNKKPNGEGCFKWENGEQYIGQWSNAQKHGFGQWIGTQDDYYIGQWVNGQQDGLGEHKWNGDIYLGQWKNSVKNGYGVEQFQNGDKYIGNYYFGKPQGQGEYRWVDGSIYSGQFQEGMRHGYGKHINKNGIIYEGEYQKDLKHGIGKLIQIDGSSYQGSFVHDHRDLPEVVYQKSDKIAQVAYQINQSSINYPLTLEKPKQKLTQRDNKTIALQNQQIQLNQTYLNTYQDPNIQFFHNKLQNLQLPEIQKMKKGKIDNKSARTTHSMNQKRTSQLKELKQNQKSASIDLQDIYIGDAYRTIKKKQTNYKDKNYQDLINNNKKSIKNVFVY